MIRAKANWNQDASEVDQLLDHMRGQNDSKLRDSLCDAIVLRLAAKFQKYCLARHDELVEEMVSRFDNRRAEIVRAGLTLDRRLEQGNASIERLRQDYRRVGVELTDDRLGTAISQLADLLACRNLLAHGSVPKKTVTWFPPDIDRLTSWRDSCASLVEAIEKISFETLKALEVEEDAHD